MRGGRPNQRVVVMVPTIQVTCPHCGARGQIVLPPLGSIVIGPCPQCEEVVAVFCGQALPLQKDIILNGTYDERFEHVASVLQDFVEERLTELFQQAAGGPEPASSAVRGAPGAASRESGRSSSDKPSRITQAEVEHFLRFELPRLDNRYYFKAIFD